MGFTAKLVLNKARIKDDGTYPIIVRVTYNRKIVNFPLSYYVQEKDWDSKNSQVKSSSKVSSSIARLNGKLKHEQAKIFDKVTELDVEGPLASMTTKEVKQAVVTSESQKQNLYDYIDTLIEEKKKAHKKSSALAYRGVKRKLQDLYGDRLHSFEQIDYSVLKALETKHLGDGGSYGGLGVYMRTFRAICNRAIKDKMVSSDFYPFKEYKIKKGDTKRKALSEDDLTAFKNYQSHSKPLIFAQDLFMASFYMRGMNFIDMAHLTRDNIEGNLERIRYQRNKTGKYFSIKVSEALRVILNKYLRKSQSETFVFPILDDSVSESGYFERIRNSRLRVNKWLKVIATELEIETFTIYAARHTYATMGKRKGVPTAVIQESLGHETEVITQTYLDSFDNSVVDEYDELIMA